MNIFSLFASTCSNSGREGDPYLESRRVELVWILEVVRAVMDVPEERHHLPTLGDKEPYTPRKIYTESESELSLFWVWCIRAEEKKGVPGSALPGDVAPRRPQAAA
jgi:hypothetical protein